jgi:hypothetical protein
LIAASFDEKELNPEASKSDANKRSAYDLTACGGEALLHLVLGHVSFVFEDDKKGRELMYQRIKPEFISEPEFITFKICYRLSKLGKTPEEIFS